MLLSASILHFQKSPQGEGNGAARGLDPGGYEIIEGRGGGGQFRQPAQKKSADGDMLDAPQDDIPQQLGIDAFSNGSFFSRLR